MLISAVIIWHTFKRRGWGKEEGVGRKGGKEGWREGRQKEKKVKEGRNEPNFKKKKKTLEILISFGLKSKQMNYRVRVIKLCNISRVFHYTGEEEPKYI